MGANILSESISALSKCSLSFSINLRLIININKINFFIFDLNYF
jgi:hypothetical protein